MRTSCGRRRSPWPIDLLVKRGAKLLYAVAWPPQGIYAKKELRSAADMKGLKWRAYNPATSKIAQVVGAQSLTIQAAELSQALATGAVDSFMSSGATGVDSKVWETLTHFHTVDAWLPKNMVIVNLREFEKLDKPTQAASAEGRGETPNARAGNACAATPMSRSPFCRRTR